jgi:hypothetical protein
LAANAPVAGANPVLDEFGRPVPPEGLDDLVDNLWRGPVAVRDLDVLVEIDPDGGADSEIDDSTTSTDSSVTIESPGTTDDAESEDPDAPVTTDEDEVVESDEPVDPGVVVVDRRDAFLVFAQVSPELVSTASPGLSFRIEVGFDEEQLAGSDGLFASNSQAARRLIGEILFFQGNVVSVDTTELPDGAPAVSRVEVADEQFLADAEEFAPILFGESEVVLADSVLEGVDVVVKVGTGYIDFRRGN